MSETATLKVGDEAPDFELPSNPMCEKFKLSDLRGKNAVIINFVPAVFSTICSAQAPIIEQKRVEFESQGAIPVAISSDGPWAQQAWREQLGLNYPVSATSTPSPTPHESMALPSNHAWSPTALWPWWARTVRSPGSSPRRRSPTSPTTTR